MPCYHPMQAVRFDSITKSGKKVVRFIKPATAEFIFDKSKILVLPCGRCVGCRLERSRQWAIRCEKEMQLVESNGGKNCFITLTFDDEQLYKRDRPMSLDKRDFQLFMKRLRKKSKRKIRFYHCGEYGDLFKRPHYHAILFNFDFEDKVLWKVVNGNRLYTSESLSKLWKFGFSTIGAATFDSAAYVARYIMKKQTGKNAWKTYAEYIDEETGELVGHRIPEYTTMSRRSGIGKEWLDKYLIDVYPSDEIFVRGKMRMCKPPRYYDSLYEIRYPSDYSSIKEARVKKALELSLDNTPERLAVKKKIMLKKTKILKRSVE